MQKISDGWWRTLLKDKATNLYARVDFIKRADDELAISIDVERLSMRLMITFADGEVTMSLSKMDGEDTRELLKESMKFDGSFVWKQEQGNSNKR